MTDEWVNKVLNELRIAGKNEIRSRNNTNWICIYGNGTRNL
jgi:hypothetical protein